ncbi:MAG: hypothetical protein L0Z73_18500 [Gammaproteobacteria bacterium]|nr:hypothetical protein [Gammaproteobacteria bacterium]
MSADKGLILYISNSSCVGSYCIATHELVIATGEINGKEPAKLIHFRQSKIRVDCGPQQSLILIQE